MKRLKLRKEVKNIIGVGVGVGIAIIVMISIIVLDHNYVERNVARCISRGVDSNVCEELRK